MAPKSSNSNAYKDGIKLDLGQLKKHDIQQVKVFLIKINITRLSSLIGILSEDVNMYMELLAANRYYALGYRTIHFLSHGAVDMSATTAEFGSTPASGTGSDSEVNNIFFGIETEVGIFVAGKHKRRAGGAFFQIFTFNKP